MSRRTYERKNIWLERPRTNDQTDRQTDNQNIGVNTKRRSQNGHHHHHQPQKCHRNPISPIKPPHRSPASRTTNRQPHGQPYGHTNKPPNEMPPPKKSLTSPHPMQHPESNRRSQVNSTQAPVPTHLPTTPHKKKRTNGINETKNKQPPRTTNITHRRSCVRGRSRSGSISLPPRGACACGVE